MPETVVPGNYFGYKAFRRFTLEINHEELNKKNRSDLPCLTRYFTSRLNYSDSNLKQLGELEGFWSNDSYSGDDLLEHEQEVTKRRQNATLSVEDGVNFYTYQMILPLDVGLSSLTKPLPKDCYFLLKCELANSCKALMGLDTPVNDAIGDITASQPLTLINPQLEATFFYSDTFDSKLATYKMNKLKWPFTQHSMFTLLLQSALDIHTVRIEHGR